MNDANTEINKLKTLSLAIVNLVLTPEQLQSTTFCDANQGTISFVGLFVCVYFEFFVRLFLFCFVFSLFLHGYSC